MKNKKIPSMTFVPLLMVLAMWGETAGGGTVPCENRPQKAEGFVIFGYSCVDDFYDGAFFDGIDWFCVAGGDAPWDDFDAEGAAEIFHGHQNTVDAGK